jgi:hypothetical protein
MLTEEQRRENFRKLWIDLGPKMAAKNVGRDKEAEDLFMLGWALGAQEGVQIGVDEAVAITHEIRSGNDGIRRCGDCEQPRGLCECN